MASMKAKIVSSPMVTVPDPRIPSRTVSMPEVIAELLNAGKHVKWGTIHLSDKDREAVIYICTKGDSEVESICHNFEVVSEADFTAENKVLAADLTAVDSKLTDLGAPEDKPSGLIHR